MPHPAAAWGAPPAPALLRGAGACRPRGPLSPARAAASGPAGDTQPLKADLVRLVANTKRGKAATPAQRGTILGAIEALEALNPTPSPTRTPLVSGDWSLLYQAPTTEEAAADKAATLEGPFLAAFQPLTEGLVRTKRDLQVIDLDEGRVENLAEFVAFGVDGSLNIVGTAAPSSDTRIDVEFTEFQLGLGGRVLRVPLSWVQPRGWVETTYVDEDMRIGRGDKGSVFVTARAK